MLDVPLSDFFFSHLGSACLQKGTDWFKLVLEKERNYLFLGSITTSVLEKKAPAWKLLNRRRVQ